MCVYICINKCNIYFKTSVLLKYVDFFKMIKYRTKERKYGLST